MLGPKTCLSKSKTQFGTRQLLRSFTVSHPKKHEPKKLRTIPKGQMGGSLFSPSYTPRPRSPFLFCCWTCFQYPFFGGFSYVFDVCLLCKPDCMRRDVARGRRDRYFHFWGCRARARAVRLAKFCRAQPFKPMQQDCYYCWKHKTCGWFSFYPSKTSCQTFSYMDSLMPTPRVAS